MQRSHHHVSAQRHEQPLPVSLDLLLVFTAHSGMAEADSVCCKAAAPPSAGPEAKAEAEAEEEEEEAVRALSSPGPPSCCTPLLRFARRAMKPLMWAGLALFLVLCCTQGTRVACVPWSSRKAPAQDGVVVEEVEFVVQGEDVVATIDDDFLCATLDWWPPQKCDYGTCSWGNASLLNVDLANPLLELALAALAPFKVRLGGSLQDQIVYQVGLSNASMCAPLVPDRSTMFGFSGGCFPLSRWDSLSKLFAKTRSTVAFGLNALYGRIPSPGGGYSGPWDSSNAEAFIRYTVERGYAVQAWEFGNELGGQGVGTTISASQFAEDVKKLKGSIAAAYAGLKPPILVAPDSFFDPTWYAEMFQDSGYGVVDVASRHIYNLGPGSDPGLINKILDPDYLGGEARNYQAVQTVLQEHAPWCDAWIGEAGGAYNSGKHLVTDAFVSGFWYVHQLGMAASFKNKAFCRQSLIGGNYGLLNTTTFHPNPDFYSALLWKRLVGKKVLRPVITLKSQAPKSFLRGYVHCHKEDKGSITVILLNFSRNTTHSVNIVSGLEPARQSYRSELLSTGSRLEYHLSAQSPDSQEVWLNARPLTISDRGHLPILAPTEAPMYSPVQVQPLSIVFVVVPQVDLPACFK